MIIHNFYFILWYALWLYILLCLSGKIVWDHWKGQRQNRKKRRIQSFFSLHKALTPHWARRLRKFARDDVLFEVICESYVLLREQYIHQEREKMDVFMQTFLTETIRSLPTQDHHMRCLILYHVKQLSFQCPTARQILLDWKPQSRLEQILIEEISIQKAESLVR